MALAFAVAPARAQGTPEPATATVPSPNAEPSARSQPAVPAEGDQDETLSSSEQGQRSVDESFRRWQPGEWLRESKREGLRDTKFAAQIRSFDMDRENFNGTKNVAWALGGSAGFETGYFGHRLALGATGYTSQPLYGPLDKAGTDLLTSTQQGYSVLGQAYGTVLISEDISAHLGRVLLDTSYVGRNDSRMTPNTFEAYTVEGGRGSIGDKEGWQFGAGYVSKIKNRNSEQFESMATQAGAPAGVSRGVYVAGAGYRSHDFSIGGVEYYSADIINIAYVETKYALALSKEVRLQLAAQYTDQRSTGQDLLLGYAFSAHQFGVKGEAAFAGALLTAAYTGTAGSGNTDMQSPWNKYPGYTSVQINDFDRAGEDAWMIRAAYVFPILKRLEAYALYVHGTQPPAAKQYARDETNLNLQWKASSGLLKGLMLRARYGYSTQGGPGRPSSHDVRLILYYDVPGI